MIPGPVCPILSPLPLCVCVKLPASSRREGGISFISMIASSSSFIWVLVADPINLSHKHSTLSPFPYVRAAFLYPSYHLSSSFRTTPWRSSLRSSAFALHDLIVSFNASRADSS
ncbi:hypothetical protein DL95DRAFT_496101, partial [Leptodontidium sp. 2 PMI_412]